VFCCCPVTSLADPKTLRVLCRAVSLDEVDITSSNKRRHQTFIKNFWFIASMYDSRVSHCCYYQLRCTQNTGEQCLIKLWYKFSISDPFHDLRIPEQANIAVRWIIVPSWRYKPLPPRPLKRRSRHHLKYTQSVQQHMLPWQRKWRLCSRSSLSLVPAQRGQ